MREIKFRGLCVRDNKQWVYGSCQKLDALKYPGIIEPKRGGKCYEVLPETVGQYTGLTDRNEVEIYEGDIIRHINEEADKTPYVVPEVSPANWDTLAGIGDDEWCMGQDQYSNIEVIGNIHQNPELLNK